MNRPSAKRPEKRRRHEKVCRTPGRQLLSEPSRCSASLATRDAEIGSGGALVRGRRSSGVHAPAGGCWRRGCRTVTPLRLHLVSSSAGVKSSLSAELFDPPAEHPARNALRPRFLSLWVARRRDSHVVVYQTRSRAAGTVFGLLADKIIVVPWNGRPRPTTASTSAARQSTSTSSFTLAHLARAFTRSKLEEVERRSRCAAPVCGERAHQRLHCAPRRKRSVASRRSVLPPAAAQRRSWPPPAPAAAMPALGATKRRLKTPSAPLTVCSRTE